MCQVISDEEFDCGHIIGCLLKYPLLYCPAPNGIPFHGETLMNRWDILPSRFCAEETWVDMTMMKAGPCPSCQIDITVPSKEKVFVCGHNTVVIPGGLLQGCFSPKREGVEVDMDVDMDYGPYRETVDRDSKFPFSFGLGKDISCGFPLCPLSFGKEEDLTKEEKTKRAKAPQGAMVPLIVSPEDIELSKFNKACDTVIFSWRKYSLLNLWSDHTWRACPQCERVWANRKAEVEIARGIDQGQEHKSGNAPRYRARKPKGLAVDIDVGGKLPQLQVVQENGLRNADMCLEGSESS